MAHHCVAAHKKADEREPRFALIGEKSYGQTLLPILCIHPSSPSPNNITRLKTVLHSPFSDDFEMHFIQFNN